MSRKKTLHPWVCQECLVNLRPLVDYDHPLDQRWICPKCLRGWKERNPIIRGAPFSGLTLVKLGE
jgi:hypothetical protein